MRRIAALSLLLLVAVVIFAADTLPERSVVVKVTPVRDKAMYAGRELGKLEYTDRVQVLELPAGSSWARVRSAARKLEGWVHLSTLSREGRLVVKEGDETVKTPPSGYTVALAGKGFNKEIDEQNQKNQALNYRAVQAMEDYSARITQSEVAAFILQGGLSSGGGAR